MGQEGQEGNTVVAGLMIRRSLVATSLVFSLGCAVTGANYRSQASGGDLGYEWMVGQANWYTCGLQQRRTGVLLRRLERGERPINRRDGKVDEGVWR